MPRRRSSSPASARRAPDMPVIAEEEMAGGRITPASAASLCWLVDPLDGTKEFLAGRDEFAVNIGAGPQRSRGAGRGCLARHRRALGGIVGSGAWKADANGRRDIAARLPPAEGLTVMASALAFGRSA